MIHALHQQVEGLKSRYVDLKLELAYLSAKLRLVTQSIKGSTEAKVSKRSFDESNQAVLWQLHLRLIEKIAEHAAELSPSEVLELFTQCAQSSVERESPETVFLRLPTVLSLSLKAYDTLLNICNELEDEFKLIVVVTSEDET